MTRGQKVFGCCVLLAVAYSALHYYLFEVIVWGLRSDGLRGAFEDGFVQVGHRLPYLLTPYLIAQQLLLGFWAIRPPGPTSGSDLPTSVLRLSEWLRWNALLLVLFVAGALIAFLANRMLAVYFMSLIPLFGVAYAASVYRCLRLNQHLESQGMSGFSTRTLALGAWLASVLGFLWPLGLGVPVSVWRRVRGLKLAP